MMKRENRFEMELKLLKDLSLSIANADNFNTALNTCLETICKATGWAYGEVWVTSKDNTYTYISNAFYGEHDELKEFYEESKKLELAFGTGFPGLTWQNKQPIRIKDIYSSSNFARKELAKKFNLNSALSIPIIVDDRVIAIMVFLMFEAEEDDEFVELFSTIVAQLSALFKRLLLDSKLHITNRALRLISEGNQAIIRATDETSLLHNICSVAVKSGGYRMCLVAFAQHDARKSIKIITYAGFTGDYIEQLSDLSWAEGHPKSSLSGRVIRTGRPFVIRDVRNDPNFAPWRDSALKQGFQSVIFLPLIVNQEVIGVLNMYASEADAFGEEEQRLLEEFANDVAYGIMMQRTKTENQRLQAQLLQSQKMEAMGQLAAGIAHDFNNILTAITGYGTMLYNKLKDDKELGSYIKQILDASEKALELVQELLTFSRKHDIDLKPLDINQLITRLSGLLKRLLGKHVVMNTELADMPLTIMGNKNKLEQVLMNLVDNANDAMPQGGVLTISTGAIEMDEEFIRAHGFGRKAGFALIKIADTGTGIEKDNLDKIFEPFFTTKPVGKGTGLGLSVVYGIIKQHNGYIDVSSEPGKGTTFFIYLPLVRE
ncbi:MAG: GAF domain-containing protein [bacterium]